ncbi:hypothetical protein VFPBJ_08850 [Purpureocillium lilacinum]|uniref:Uncharacterized protein n=1 Tax=Purpureocillium lilacinum TaxID=33203 RepID=A0A179GGA9_PURLI|nr:hypothetical protein VFPBJ_08850 [Purpureocillium lilacinum]
MQHQTTRSPCFRALAHHHPQRLRNQQPAGVPAAASAPAVVRCASAPPPLLQPPRQPASQPGGRHSWSSSYSVNQSGPVKSATTRDQAGLPAAAGLGLQLCGWRRAKPRHARSGTQSRRVLPPPSARPETLPAIFPGGLGAERAGQSWQRGIWLGVFRWRGRAAKNESNRAVTSVGISPVAVAAASEALTVYDMTPYVCPLSHLCVRKELPPSQGRRGSAAALLRPVRRRARGTLVGSIVVAVIARIGAARRGRCNSQYYSSNTQPMFRRRLDKRLPTSKSSDEERRVHVGHLES